MEYKYLDYLCTRNGQLAEYWTSCVDIVDIFCPWSEHQEKGIGHCIWPPFTASSLGALHTINRIMPSISVCYCQMTRLPDTHPDVREHMLQGGFSVQWVQRTHLVDCPLPKLLKNPSTRTHRTTTRERHNFTIRVTNRQSSVWIYQKYRYIVNSTL